MHSSRRRRYRFNHRNSAERSIFQVTYYFCLICCNDELSFQIKLFLLLFYFFLTHYCRDGVPKSVQLSEEMLAMLYSMAITRYLFLFFFFFGITEILHFFNPVLHATFPFIINAMTNIPSHLNRIGRCPTLILTYEILNLALTP